MRNLCIYAALGFAAVLAAGCGSQPGSSVAAPDRPSSSAASSESGSEPARPDSGAGKAGNVFAPLENDLEKARGVQNTVNQQAERLRKQIEKAEGAKDDDTKDDAQ